MTARVLFIGEGSSDNGLVPHVESIAARKGLRVSITVPDFGLLRLPTGHSVRDKLRAARELHGTYDLAVVQRDADRGPAQDRRDEIEQAVCAEWPGLRHVAVVPVRMLEAWLLLDEACLRQVAENPRGRVGLDLPKGTAAERVADPKQLLKDSLARASEYKGAVSPNSRSASRSTGCACSNSWIRRGQWPAFHRGGISSKTSMRRSRPSVDDLPKSA